MNAVLIPLPRRSLYTPDMPPCRIRVVCQLFAALALPNAPAPAGETVTPVVYEVRFAGIEDRDLLDELRRYSQAVALQGRPPATVALLEHRAQGDVERFEAFLASEGYFSGQAGFELESDTIPAQLLYRLVRGPGYRLREENIVLPGNAAFPFLEPKLNLGERVTTVQILEEEARLIRQLRNHGYPFTEALDRDVVVDHAERLVEVTYRLEPGPEATFGEVSVDGLRRAREEAVLQRIPWEEGSSFDQRQVEAFRRDLLATGMFLTARVEGGTSLNADGSLPVSVEVRERTRRTLRLGLEYVSDIGFGVSLDWDYRNFLRREVFLQTSLTYSEIELSGEIQLTRDKFLHRDQRLAILLRLAEDRPDAYVSVNGEIAVLLSRNLTSRLRVIGGLALKVSEVEQGPLVDNYTLLLSPWTVDYNFSDDLLDPRTGGRAFGEFAPYTDIRSGDLTFTRTFLEYRHYLPIRFVPGLTLAGRVALGSIGGASRGDIPADERFFAGGGGSVRGYEYQTVGEVVEGSPVGGKSLFETSLEARSQFGERWGLVAFVDGGMAYEDSTPSNDPPLQWGAGLGLRVFTGLGPVRLDGAVPVNPRDDLDDDYQFYISLGQAF